MSLLTMTQDTILQLSYQSSRETGDAAPVDMHVVQ